MLRSEFVRTDFGRQHVIRGGSGSATVVLEPAIGDVGRTWALVLPLLEPHAAYVTRDRPGLGTSEAVETERSAATMVGELREVLGALDRPAPYVLVGHSFASLVVQLFALAHPDEVAGVVLVDGAHEDQFERFPSELNPASLLSGFAARLRTMAGAAGDGEEVSVLVAPPPGFPPAEAEAYQGETEPTPTRLITMAAEYEELDRSRSQVRELATAGLGDVPLIALRHGTPQPVPGIPDEVNVRYEQVWVELQEELAARSRRGRVEVAENAGHNIHHERPDLVADFIREVAMA